MMDDYIISVFGRYARCFIIELVTLLEYLIAVFIFVSPVKRKRHFPLRLVVCLAAHVCVALLLSLWRENFDTYLTRILSTMVNYLLPLPLVVFCFDDEFSAIIMYWCAGIAAGEAGVWIIDLGFTALGVDIYESITVFPWLPQNRLRDWIIYLLLHLVIYGVFFLICGRVDLNRQDRRQNRNVSILGFASVILLSVFVSTTREFRNDSRVLFIVIMAYNLVLCAFLLFLRAGILFHSRTEREFETMERVLSEERKQYDSIKESMNIINMKCHDLKHQLNDISGKLTEQEISSLRNAIQIYDSNIKTGSEVLDTILYEKQLICQKEHIQLSCMADGTILSFMRTTHIYALFNNAIGNAMEAVRIIDDLDKRVISLSVAREGTDIVIEVANYYIGNIEMYNGLPVTGKSDRNHHGFGIMSIKYIAEQYKGQMSVSAENGLFALVIRFPLNAS